MPIAIDLYCGLGGWTEGLLAEGFDVIGFDLQRHVYGEECYPAQLVLQDALTLHGSQFRGAALIVASPPCQRYSYMAQPWSRAKKMAFEYEQGIRDVRDLNALFDNCFRIQDEACEAAGRYIPMVIENVKGAQRWVGPAKAHYGSFYLWGDVERVGGRIVAGCVRFGDTLAARAGRHSKNDGGSWFNLANNTESGCGNNPDGRKIPDQNWSRFAETGEVSPHWNMQSVGVKATGRVMQRDGYDHTRHLTNQIESERAKPAESTKQNGSGPEWFDSGIALLPSYSSRRRAASARMAKIPPPLSRFVARAYLPGRD